jgi:hypothetical protein
VTREPRSRRWWAGAIAGVAAVHLVLSTSLGLYVFGAGMARFDGGGPPSPGERVADAVATVLLFPAFGTGLEDRLPLRFRGGGFPWEHSVFVANSLVWGAVLVALARRWRRTASTRRGLTAGLALLLAGPAVAQTPAPSPPPPPAAEPKPPAPAPAPRAPARPTLRIPAAELARYSGFYDAGTTVAEVAVADGTLSLVLRRSPGTETHRLKPLGGHRFAAEDDPELRVAFEMGPQVAQWLTISRKDATVRAKRIVD